MNLPFTTFTELEVWNDERYSGKNSITFKDNAFKVPGVLEVLSAKVKDSFRISIPRDIVHDPNSDIFALGNHLQLKGDATLAKWLAKMRGNFVEIKLTTDNTQGPLFLYDVLTEVSENIR